VDKEVIKKISREVLILLPIFAFLSWILWDKIIALNIMIGGLTSWLSLKELSWAVKKFFGKPMFQMAVIGLSYIKLGLIFIFLMIIARYGLFNVYGLLAGFAVVLIISSRQALLHSRRQNI
jgi:hypothetical protein